VYIIFIISRRGSLLWCSLTILLLALGQLGSLLLLLAAQTLVVELSVLSLDLVVAVLGLLASSSGTMTSNC
jgi:hypothetical protein